MEEERADLEKKLATALQRLGKTLALLHSDKDGESAAALRACLNNFKEINEISATLNPDAPLTLSFPELLRLADSAGNAELLKKIEELFQANAALKASEDLLLQDRTRLEHSVNSLIH